MKNSQKFRIFLYCVMTTFFWFSGYAYVPYLSTYGASMTQSAALVGFMLGAYGWAQLVLRIPIGIISDRLNNRRVFIRIGCMLLSVSAFGFYLAPGINWLIACRALTGVSASVWVAISVLFGSYFDKASGVKALTLLNACNLLGQMLASIVVMPVTATYGIRSSFLVAAVAGIIPLLISFTLKDRKLERKPLQLTALLAVGRTRWVLGVSTMCILSQLMTFATNTGFTPQLALALGAKPSVLSWILLISTAGGAIVSFLSPRFLIDRFGALNTVVFLLAVQSVTCLLQPLAPTLTVLLGIVFFSGLARGTAVSLMLGLVIMPFPYEKQAAAMGFYQALYSLGIILGPTIAGAVMQTGGLAMGFYVIGLLGLMAPLVGLALIREKRALALAAE